MNEAEKRGIYMERFPFPLNEMMASQLSDTEIHKWASYEHLLTFFGKWRLSKEGKLFWQDIQSLYIGSRLVRLGRLPTSEEIKEVFIRHNIHYPKNAEQKE